MCSVARNFSRFSSCRFVLVLVCSTMSSAEHVTSGATPGTEVSTLGGAHGVTEAAETEGRREEDRKSTRLNSSHMSISYAVFCLKKKKKNTTTNYQKKTKKKKTK